MSGSKISIIVSAVDRASEKFEGINKRIAKINAPVSRLQKSFGRFSDASGITKLSKGFTDLARGSLNAFENIARVVDPLAAITGAASIAGLTALVTGFAALAQSTSLAAAGMNTSTSSLQLWRGVAVAAGLGADAGQKALSGLQAAAFASIGGRDQGKFQSAMLQIGLSRADIAKAARDPASMMQTILQQIQARVKSGAGRQITADALGVGDIGGAIMPGARPLSADIASATNAVVSPQAIAQATALANAINDLKNAWTGFSGSIAGALSPVLMPYLKFVTDWLSDTKNQNMLQSKLNYYVQTFIGWLRSPAAAKFGADLKMIGRGILDIATALADHWKVAAAGLLLYMTGPFALTMLGIFAATGPLGLAIAGIAAAIAAVVLATKALPIIEKNFPIGAKAIFNYATGGGNTPISPHGVPRGIGGNSPGSGPTRGQRDNNPLNYTGDGMGGEVGKDGMFGVYNNLTNGVAASVYQLLRNQNVHGDKTLTQKMNDPVWKWNHSPDPGGNYLKGILSQPGFKGVNPDAPYDVNDPKKMAALVQAMAHEEIGTGIDPKIVAAGVSQGMGNAPPVQLAVTVDHKNAPDGVAASVKSSNAKIVQSQLRVTKQKTAQPMTNMHGFG